MKSLFVSLIVIATCAAQAQQPAPCLKLSKVTVEKHVLHQDSEADVNLVFVGQHCYVFSGSPAQGRQWPVFELQSEPGLTVSTAFAGLSRFDQTTVGASILRAGEVEVRVHLAASSDFALGGHKLPGLIRYKVMDGLGNISDQALSFEVPITVAKAEPVHVPGPPFDQRHPVWAKVLLPLEIIAFIPLFILAGLMGWDGC